MPASRQPGGAISRAAAPSFVPAAVRPARALTDPHTASWATHQLLSHLPGYLFGGKAGAATCCALGGKLRLWVDILIKTR